MERSFLLQLMQFLRRTALKLGRLFQSRRTQLRDMDTALVVLRRVRAQVDAWREEPNGFPEFDRAAIVAQLRWLPDLVDDFRLPIRQLTEGSPLATSHLESFVFGGPINALAPLLKTLEEVLQTKRAMLHASLNGHDPAGTVSTEAQPSLAASGQAAAPLLSGARTKRRTPVADEPIARGTDAAYQASPDHGTVLWNVTEKLYASWPMRAVVIMLALSIMLAGGGAAVIGNQTLNVRQELDKAQERALREVGEIGKTTRETLDQQQKQLAANLANRQLEISNVMKQAEKEVKDLQTGAHDLQARAVSQITTKMLENFKDEESRLRDRIIGPLNEIKNEKLPPLQQVLVKAQDDLKKIEAGIKDAQATLSALQIERLKGSVQDTDKITTALNAIRADQKEVNDIKIKIAQQAESAGVHLEETRIVTDATKYQRDQAINAVRATLDEIIKHNQGIGQITTKLAGLNADITAQSDRLKTVGVNVTLIEQGSKEMPKPVLVQTDLRPSEWRQIQNRLKIEGLYKASITGRLDGNTTQAIRAYQRNNNISVTGVLSPEQINLLLKPQPVRETQTLLSPI